jgi:hypothetical protein
MGPGLSTHVGPGVRTAQAFALALLAGLRAGLRAGFSAGFPAGWAAPLISASALSQ